MIIYLTPPSFQHEGLSCIAYNSPCSDLDTHRRSLEASFRQQPPRSVKEAAHRIKELTGIDRSPSRVRAFLGRISRKPLRTGQIPAKADVQEQQRFHDETLQPLLTEAKAGKCHVLFLDSAHFVLAAFVAIVYTVVQLLERIAHQYAGLPIHIILDNARYQSRGLGTSSSRMPLKG